MSEDRMAPKGKIWFCPHCKREAEDRYGLRGQKSHGWDESCMLNAILVDAEPRDPTDQFPLAHGD